MDPKPSDSLGLNGLPRGRTREVVVVYLLIRRSRRPISPNVEGHLVCPYEEADTSKIFSK